MLQPEISPADAALLASEEFDPEGTPQFEEIKYCLIWPDERPESLSAAGWDLIGDLLAARGLIHRGRPLAADGDLRRVWNWALLEVQLPWNGFRRIALDPRGAHALADELARDVVPASRFGRWRPTRAPWL